VLCYIIGAIVGIVSSVSFACSEAPSCAAAAAPTLRTAACPWDASKRAHYVRRRRGGKFKLEHSHEDLRSASRHHGRAHNRWLHPQGKLTRGRIRGGERDARLPVCSWVFFWHAFSLRMVGMTCYASFGS
jgi:hypothetical protein